MSPGWGTTTPPNKGEHMAPLEDRLEEIEYHLENARNAGNQQSIHVLTAMRNHTIHQIHTTRLHRQPNSRTA